MRINNKSLLKVFSLNAVLVASNFIIGALSTKIIAVLLGAQGMALLGSFRNFTTMAKSISTVGLQPSLIKLWIDNKANKNELNSIVRSYFWFFFIASLVICFLLIIFSDKISHYLFYTNNFKKVVIFYALLLPIIALHTLGLSILNAKENFKLLIKIQIIASIISFIIFVVFVYKKNVVGALYAVALAEIVLFICTIFYVFKLNYLTILKSRNLVKKLHLSTLKNYILMGAISGIIAPLTLILIRYKIVDVLSIDDAGKWDAINRISTYYMMFFTSGLAMYYLPKLSSIHKNKEFSAELINYFKIILPMFIVVAILVFLLKDIIITTLFTTSFYSITQIIHWQILGDLLKIISLAFGYWIVSKTMTKAYIFGEFLYNISYYFFVIYLLPLSNLLGVVQAYFYCNLLYVFFIIIIFRKVILSTLKFKTLE